MRAVHAAGVASHPSAADQHRRRSRGRSHDLGFPPEAGKFIFIIGRVAGLTAEVAEEYAREKPMRVRIPVQHDGTSAPGG